MKKFKYHPAPKAGGGLTTRCVLGTQILESTITPRVATAAGITAPQVELAIKSFLDTLLEEAEDNGWARNLYGRLSFRPTSGGKATTPDGFQNAEDINAGVSITYTAETIAAWRTRLVLQSEGEVGLATPMIDKVVNTINDHENEYTADEMVLVRGDDLAIDKDDTNQGLFVIKADGSEVCCLRYAEVDSGGFLARIPAAITGPIRVRVAAFLNGSLRTYTYGPTLTPSA